MPASAESTVQAKVSRSGARPSVVGAETVTSQRVVDESEDAAEHGAGHGLLQQDRAGLVDRDAQILDLVEGEVQAGREAGRGRTQHRQVGTRSGQPDFHEVLIPGSPAIWDTLTSKVAQALSERSPGTAVALSEPCGTIFAVLGSAVTLSRSLTPDVARGEPRVALRCCHS